MAPTTSREKSMTGGSRNGGGDGGKPATNRGR